MSRRREQPETSQQHERQDAQIRCPTFHSELRLIKLAYNIFIGRQAFSKGVWKRPGVAADFDRVSAISSIENKKVRELVLPDSANQIGPVV
jgi:hypothetical protein